MKFPRHRDRITRKITDVNINEKSRFTVTSQERKKYILKKIGVFHIKACINFVVYKYKAFSNGNIFL